MQTGLRSHSVPALKLTIHLPDRFPDKFTYFQEEVVACTINTRDKSIFTTENASIETIGCIFERTISYQGRLV